MNRNVCSVMGLLEGKIRLGNFTFVPYYIPGANPVLLEGYENRFRPSQRTVRRFLQGS